MISLVPLQKSITYFDLETDSLRKNAQIIQLAALAVDDGILADSFEVKLAFDKAKADPEALKMNNYSDELWQDAVSPFQAVNMFNEFLSRRKTVEKISKQGKPYKTAQLAGYNSAAFDMPLLVELFAKHQRFSNFGFQSLDVLQLVLWYAEVDPSFKPVNFKLGTILQYLKVDHLVTGPLHEATADCLGTKLIRDEILVKLGQLW